MTKEIRQGLIGLNAVGVLLFGLLWFNISWFAPLSSNMRVTDLDRNQIIDEAKLQEYRPDLAQNLRYRLACWIAEVPLQRGLFASAMGMLVCTINLLLLVVASISIRRAALYNPAS